jgi:glycosyltransferase involved in cell wall biosynthesis
MTVKVAIMGGLLDEGSRGAESIVRFTNCLINEISRLGGKQTELCVVHYQKESPEVHAHPYCFTEYSPARVKRIIVPEFRYLHRVLNKASYCGGKVMLPRVTLDPLILRKYHFDTIHYPYVGFCVDWALLSSLSSARVVATLHAIEPLLLSSKVYFGERKSLHVCTALLRLFCKKVSKLVAVSESAKEDFVKYLHVPKEKVRVIYHGVEEKFRVLREKDLNETLERKYGIVPPFIIHVSNCGPRKNVLSLMKAFYKAHKMGIKHKLVLVGPKSRVERLLDQLDPVRPFFQRNLKILEEISDDDLVRLYNAADALVFPSLQESFGLCILEAMACGCPVLASNRYSLPEIAGNAAIYTDPYNLNQLSSGIYRILTDHNLRDSLRRNGLERAKMFRWKTAAEQYLKLYQELT